MSMCLALLLEIGVKGTIQMWINYMHICRTNSWAGNNNMKKQDFSKYSDYQNKQVKSQ